jgi:hypothetical protein
MWIAFQGAANLLRQVKRNKLKEKKVRWFDESPKVVRQCYDRQIIILAESSIKVLREELDLRL